MDVLVDAGVLRMVTIAEKERKQLDQHGDENLQLMFPVLTPTITNDPNGTFDGAPPLAARSVAALLRVQTLNLMQLLCARTAHGTCA